MKAMAAIAWAPGEPWSVEEIEVDPPGPGEVLVEWGAGGLCHSDEGLRNGDRVPPGVQDIIFPMIGGHEGAGIVTELGPGVTEFAVGDHVVGSFVPACGKCPYCATGRAFLCNVNQGFMDRGQLVDGAIKHRARGRDIAVMAKLGTFSERATVAVASLLPIDNDLDLAAAALVSCGATTGWGAAVERGGTKPGDVVVVVGLGGLGSSAVQGALVAGAAHIVAVDPLALRRDSALKLGATYAAASIAEAREQIMHLTNGQGADVVVLTPTYVTPDILHDGLDITGKGATCVIVGMGPLGESSVQLDIGQFALYNKDLRGCLFGSMDPRAAVPRLLGLYRQGRLDLDAMVTTYPLDAINEALADNEAGRIIRAVVTMNGAAAG